MLHLISHPTQYYAPLYRRLAATPGLDLSVAFYCDTGFLGSIGQEFNDASRWDTPLTAGYVHEFLGLGDASINGAKKFSLAARVVSRVKRKRFDVVWIGGYSTTAAAAALLSAYVRSVGVVLMDDVTLLDKRPWARRVIKQILVPFLFRNIHAVYAGSQNRRFFRRFGVPEENLFFAPHSVDNAFFRGKAFYATASKSSLGRSFGLPQDVPVVLFCGKLVPRKDPFTLIRAFARVRRELPCALLVVGEGPLRRALEQYVRAEGLADVRFTGFLNQSEIGNAYAAADILVLPSREGETWGLVVNEAMNFSLPVIVSDRVGCAGDIVVHGENGFVFPVGSEHDLAWHIRSLVGDKNRRESFGLRSLRRIEGWDVDRTAAGIVDACRAAASRR